MIDLIYILYFVDAKHEDCQPSGIVENISALPRMKIKPHTFSRGSSMMVAAKLLLFLTSVIHHGSSQPTCPSECNCDFTYHVTVNCSSRGLSALPPNIPVNVSTLILRGNHLSRLDGLTRFHQLQVCLHYLPTPLSTSPLLFSVETTSRVLMASLASTSYRCWMPVIMSSQT